MPQSSRLHLNYFTAHKRQVTFSTLCVASPDIMAALKLWSAWDLTAFTGLPLSRGVCLERDLFRRGNKIFSWFLNLVFVLRCSTCHCWGRHSPRVPPQELKLSTKSSGSRYRANLYVKWLFCRGLLYLSYFYCMRPQYRYTCFKDNGRSLSLRTKAKFGFAIKYSQKKFSGKV